MWSSTLVETEIVLNYFKMIFAQNWQWAIGTNLIVMNIFHEKVIIQCLFNTFISITANFCTHVYGASNGFVIHVKADN